MNEAAQVDGRRLRSDESKRRIALAMLDLARGGEIEPSAEEVAERAGVGRRTVFRLFTDMDGVYREMHAVMVERITPLFSAPFEAKTWRARVDEMIERRARMFEEMRPIRNAGDAHRHRSEFLQNQHSRLVKLQRDTLMGLLPANLRNDEERIEILDLAFSFESWRRLRQEQRLSKKQAVAVWRRLAQTLFD
ncbi:MAG: TetR/AcrR family transcriptional regulator [Hyphomonadaceae bacterium]|nr:TetR/AcrR family transcriptional regulator [Hyphomonadaceae bacterium]